MRKFRIVSLIAVVLGVTTSSMALTTWIDTYDPADVLLSLLGPKTVLSYDHNILDDGFIIGDEIIGANLSITLRDDSLRDPWEIAIINLPGWTSDRVYTFQRDLDIGVSLKGQAQLSSEGKLSVDVIALWGDFYFDKSVLTVEGNSSPTSVPDGASTMFLLGFTMVGISRLSKKFVK